MERPNILWICTDQQRYDTIRALGNSQVNTPNLDQFHSESVNCSSAWCQSPVCTPSRASFLTGRYPRTTRCRQNGQTMPEDEILVSRLFADAGYRCGLAGKLHLASCSEQKIEERIEDGYHEFNWSHHPQPDWGNANAYTAWLSAKGNTWDELYGPKRSNYVTEGIPAEYHQTTWCAETTIEFLTRNKDRPWFFSFNCFAPHHPFDPPPEYLDRYNPDEMPLPKRTSLNTSFQKLDAEWAHNNPGEFHTGAMKDQDHREVRAAYLAMCEHIDHEFGRILTALEDSGQSDNTIVIFMSDHGEMLGDHGIYYKGPHFYDEAIQVPLMIRWPEKFQKGHEITGFVELLDLAPTLLDAAGLDIPERMQGHSLLPQLQGETDTKRDFVFSEYYNSWTHGDAYGTMLRTADAKIVVYHGTDQGELYNLRSDPDEYTNLWDDAESRDLKLEMMQKCFDASVFTMDPHPPRKGAF